MFSIFRLVKISFTFYLEKNTLQKLTDTLYREKSKDSPFFQKQKLKTLPRQNNGWTQKPESWGKGTANAVQMTGVNVVTTAV